MRDVQCFLGFANFYRKFIKDYSKIILPLTELTQKNRPFVWRTNANSAFEGLKQAFTSTPILMHVDPKKRFILVKDNVRKQVWRQKDKEGKRRFNGELELTLRGRDRVREREKEDKNYISKRYSISIQHSIHVCVQWTLLYKSLEGLTKVPSYFNAH